MLKNNDVIFLSAWHGLVTPVYLNTGAFEMTPFNIYNDLCLTGQNNQQLHYRSGAYYLPSEQARPLELPELNYHIAQVTIDPTYIPSRASHCLPVGIIAPLHPVEINGELLFTWLSDETIAQFGDIVDLSSVLPSELTASESMFIIEQWRSQAHIASLKDLMFQPVWIDQHGLISILSQSVYAEFFLQTYSESIRALKITNLARPSIAEIELNTYSPKEIVSSNSFFLLKSKLKIYVTSESVDFIEVPILGLGTFAKATTLFNYKGGLDLLRSLICMSTKDIGILLEPEKYSHSSLLGTWPSQFRPPMLAEITKAEKTTIPTRVFEQASVLENFKTLTSDSTISKLLNAKSTIALGIKNLKAEISSKTRNIVYLKEDIAYNQNRLKQYLQNIEDINSQIIALQNRIFTDDAQIKSNEAIVVQLLTDLENSQTTLQQAIQNAQLSFTGRKFSPEIWNNLGYIITDIKFYNESTSKCIESIALENLINDNTVISSISIQTTAPTVIIPSDDPDDKRVGGPYMIKIELRGTEPVMDVRLLDDYAHRGIADGYYYPHPHVSSHQILNNWEGWRYSTETWSRACLGEFLPIAFKAFKDCNLNMLLYGLKTWIECANVNDQWGRNVKHMPKLNTVPLSLIQHKELDLTKPYYNQEFVFYNYASNNSVTILTTANTVLKIEWVTCLNESTIALTVPVKSKKVFLNIDAAEAHKAKLVSNLTDLGYVLVLTNSAVQEITTIIALQKSLEENL